MDENINYNAEIVRLTEDNIADYIGKLAVVIDPTLPAIAIGKRDYFAKFHDDNGSMNGNDVKIALHFQKPVNKSSANSY
jgi:hypothetical protein